MRQMELFDEIVQKMPEELDEIAVMKAEYKIEREIHRLTGLLRFNPDPGGVFIARCSPDHYVLPALAEHFTLHFGETPWVIIDEKRNLCLCRENGSPAKILTLPDTFTAEKKQKDSWEDLWRLYHKSINNDARNNPGLQRQFIPERYRKYLPELQSDSL